MAQAEYVLSAQDQQLLAAIRRVNQGFDEQGNKIKKVTRTTQEADRGFAAMGKSIDGAVSGMLSTGAVLASLGAATVAEFERMTKSAEGFEKAAKAAMDFGRGRGPGGQAGFELRRAVETMGVGPQMVLGREERLSLANVMAAANEDVTPEQAIAGIQAASRGAGLLDEAGRSDLVRNMAQLNKLPLGLGDEDVADLAFRATQNRVDLNAVDRGLQRGSALGLQDADMQRLVALAVSGGKGGEGARAVEALLNRVEAGITPGAAKVAMRGGVPTVIGGKQEFGSAGEALSAVLANPDLVGGQSLGLKNALANMRSVEDLTAGDVIGDAVRSADPERIPAMRRRLAANALQEESLAVNEERDFERMTRRTELEAGMRLGGASEFSIGAMLRADAVAGGAGRAVFGDPARLVSDTEESAAGVARAEEERLARKLDDLATINRQQTEVLREGFSQMFGSPRVFSSGGE
jgi:hypothetical protein